MIQEGHSDPRENSYAVFTNMGLQKKIYGLKKKLLDNYWIAVGDNPFEMCIIDVSDADYFYHYE